MSRLGELLVRQNLITLQQLQKAQEDAKKSGGRLGLSLQKLGFIGEQALTDFLARQYGVPAINLADFEIDPEVIKLIPKEVARKHLCIPINRAGSSLIVAMSDPSNIYGIDDLKFLTGYNIEVVVAGEQAIQDAIIRHYDIKVATAPDGQPLREISYEEVMEGFDEGEIDFTMDEAGGDNIVDLENMAQEAPVVKLCNLILINAIKEGASDIHIEAYEKSYRVRYRTDGVLQEKMTPPLKLRPAITSRLKIMSNLDIAERRLPQDGRIKLKLGKGKEMDYRVSVLPCLFGEKIVMRLLDKSNLQLDMTKLGFEEAQLRDFLDCLHRPNGMTLVTGPTGSGKTTTLYSALSDLNKPTENVSTAEDPVEYNLFGINQCQMHDDIGLNFAAALRSFLRQDPDIIMVGEIRDFETAEIAVKAALTGHMVLSTLHTNDAPSTVTRLLNMGVEPFLVTASLNCVVAQRLARKVCKTCTAPDTETGIDKLLSIGCTPEEAKNAKMMRGTGKAAGGTACETCKGSGYKGRVALYEVMVFRDGLKELVLQGASAAELKAEAIRLGMRTLRMSGITKICEGTTTIEEILRVSMAD